MIETTKYLVAVQPAGATGNLFVAVRLGKRKSNYRPDYETLVTSSSDKEYVSFAYEGHRYGIRKSAFFGKSWRSYGVLAPIGGASGGRSTRHLTVIDELEPEPEGVTLEDLFAEDE